MQFNSRIIDFHALVSFTEGDTMTTEMQEIAITEDKPLLTGQADAKVRVPHTHTHILKPQIHDKMYVCVRVSASEDTEKQGLACVLSVLTFVSLSCICECALLSLSEAYM